MPDARRRRRRARGTLIGAVVLAAAAGGAHAQPAPPPAAAPADTALRTLLDVARAQGAADAAGNHAESLRLARRLRELAPTHPSIAYGLARAFARAGEGDSALAQLELGARMGDARRPLADSAFAALRDVPAHADRLARVAESFAANARPVVRGTVAFTIPDPDLVPESLAHDAATGAFYVGSLARRRVQRVVPEAPGGVARVHAFAGPAEDLLQVVGIKLDSARGRLWFATLAAGVDTAAAPARRVGRGRLLAHDVRTGRRLLALSPRDSLVAHGFNDVAVAANGDVYVTDPPQHTVWRVRAGADTLERLLPSDPLRYFSPNGLALSGDGRLLYVAFLAGVAALDLETGTLAYLEGPPDVTTGGIDGLYWHDGALLAVQNMPSLTRVVRFALDATGRRLTGAELLERAHPTWRIPTTGVVVGDAFYYVGASGVDRQRPDGSLAPAPPIPVPILRLELHPR